MRKGFNFYRSYWDVANELNDKDRLAFYDALLKKQFTNEETQLNGMVKFAYLSQKHSIDKQIDGYISQMSKRHPNEDPWQGGTQGAYVDPTQQVEEEEKEEVKEEINYQALLDFVNKTFGRKFQVISDKVKTKYKSLLKQGYKKEQITNAIKNCKANKYHIENNYQYCTLEFFSRAETIDKYSDVSEIDNSKVYTPNIIHE
jgi:hypothetical protein